MERMLAAIGLVVVTLTAVAFVVLESRPTPPADGGNANFTPIVTNDPTIIAAGDISTCANDHDSETAALVASLSGTVLTLGDNAYERGSVANYRDCFDPTWGAFKSNTYPAIGNHEYETRNAAGYFQYFGDRAGTSGEGYYAASLGSWRLIALNSNCAAVGGCGPGSKQLAWLENELATHSSTCTLAFWHHPRFSSGLHGNDAQTDALWKTLSENKADVVLWGHDHDYERFARLGTDGNPASDGMRAFTVGTGGRSLYPFISIQPGSEVRDSQDYGVLELKLHSDRYDWVFHTVKGTEFDTGSDVCR